MARKEAITCDVCGKDKGVTNHWFVIETNDNGKAVVAIYRAADNSRGHFDLCGEACVLKKVSGLIGGDQK